jgi:hypothetical protein
VHSALCVWLQALFAMETLLVAVVVSLPVAAGSAAPALPLALPPPTVEPSAGVADATHELLPTRSTEARRVQTSLSFWTIVSDSAHCHITSDGACITDGSGSLRT